MLKHILTGFALIAVAITASAKPITPEEALARLRSGNTRMSVAAKGGITPRLIHTTETADGNPAVYLFNRGEDSGFMVLAADDTAYPLLGYADEGNADPSNLPPALEWWLGEYARQIEYANSKGISAESSKYKIDIRAGWEPIAPQIKTKWDQIEPYYNMCPLVGMDYAYTGCVATAMAQVAKYWNYPAVGKGYISYECSDISKRLDMDFSLRKFDWDNMLDSYLPGHYSQKEADAVAYLMKACGYAVKMSYSTSSSGALAMNIANGMKKYLNYDKNMVYDMRMYHSSSEWEKIIYDNLKNVGPVLYGGGSMLGGGHSFVCDGYDGNGLFHFNWGWSGMSDGYFSLDALNPDALGSGGGNGGGYNFTQDAVLGIQPPTGDEVKDQPSLLTMQGSLVAEIISGYLTFDLDMENGAMWVNYNPSTLRVEVGAKFIPQGNTPGDVKYFNVSNKRYVINPGYGFVAHSITSDNVDVGLNPLISVDTMVEELADGVYKVVLETRDYTNDDAPWQPILCPYGYYDYVTVTKSGNNVTVKDVPAPSLDVTRGEITTKLMPYNVVKVSVDISNPSDIELSTGLAPVLVGNNTMLFIGESVYVTVQPHESITKEWYTSMNVMQQMTMPTEATTYQLLFLDERSLLFYDFAGTATMYPQEYPDITINSDPRVKNAVRTEETATATTYYISDPCNIEVTTRVVIQSDFSYPLLSCLCLPEDDKLAILTMSGSNQFFTSSRLPRTINTTLNYPTFEAGVKYLLYTCYTAGGYVALPSNKLVYVTMESAGVEDITVDAELSINYDRGSRSLTAVAASGVASLSAYSISGSLIGAAYGEDSDSTLTLSLDDAPQGVIIARATDSRGNTKTVKIVR